MEQTTAAKHSIMHMACMLDYPASSGLLLKRGAAAQAERRQADSGQPAPISRRVRVQVIMLC